MKYQMAILDFDGTLADTLPFVLSISDHLSNKYRMKSLDKSDISLLKNQSALELMKAYHVPAWKLPILAAEVQKLMHQQIDQIRMFHGMVEVLQSLHSMGVELAVVTSNAMKNVEKVLGKEVTALVSHFECGVSLFGKTEKLHSLLSKAGLQGTQVVSIGDETRDIEAARQAGIPCAAVTWGYASRDLLLARGPDYLLDKIDQILDIFVEGLS